MILVTGVITTHKRPPHIVERALKSILNQTHTDMEIIVVDDSPADYEYRSAVKEMVESYTKKNVKYIAHEKCSGACAARNTALLNCKGEYIGYLDDDDEWKHEKVEKQLKGFTNENVALVYCGSEVINDTTNKVTKFGIKFEAGFVYDKLILENFIGSTSFPLIKTSCLKEIGGFDVLMQSSQDYDVWLRLAEKYEVNYVDDSLVLYHIHDGEQITKNPIKKLNGQERLIEKNKAYLKTNRIAYWYRLNECLPYYVLNKEYGKAFKKWLLGCLKGPLKIENNLKNLYCIILGLMGRK